MNGNCDVIRDLLPLYRDGVCSETSRALVEEHLKACPECRSALAQIEQEVDMPTPNMQETFKAWQKLQRKILLKRLRMAALVVVLLVAAVAGGMYGHERYMFAHYPMDVNDVEITALYRLADGRIYMAMQGIEHNLSGSVTGPENRDGDLTQWSGVYRIEPEYSRYSDSTLAHHRTEFEFVITEVQEWTVKGKEYTFTTESIEIVSGDERRFVCHFDADLPAAPEEIEHRAYELTNPVNG